MEKCSNGLGHMTKMAAMHIKYMALNIFLPEPEFQLPRTLVCSIRHVSPSNFIHMVMLSWT